MLSKTNHYYILLFFLFCFGVMSGQTGIVSGTLTDADGLPLPGGTIMIKGTQLGTQTDFDGNYSIECSVGDTLLISYVGMKTREVKVTVKMITGKASDFPDDMLPVRLVTNNAYVNAVSVAKDSVSAAKNIELSNTVYSDKDLQYRYKDIKNITERDSLIGLRYYKGDLYFEINYNSNLAFRFANRKTLPKVQDTYIQGRPSNGENQWFGAETNEVFSYGPDVNSVTFDGADYLYDANGKIINGIGQRKLLPYDNDILETALISTNKVGFLLTQGQHTLDASYKIKTYEDSFGTETGMQQNVGLNYKSNKVHAFIRYAIDKFNQPDYNGFYAHVLQSALITPVSFQNSQGYQFATSEQRSFSPENFNNPNWLLYTNQNKSDNTSLSAGTKANIKLSSKIKGNIAGGYNYDRNDIQYALPKNTIGQEDGYWSKKTLLSNNANFNINLTYDDISTDVAYVKLKLTTAYNYNNVNYKFIERYGFQDFSFENGVYNNSRTKQLDNHTVNFAPEITFDFNEIGAELALKNNSIVSSLQGSRLFLPAVSVSVNIRQLLDIYLEPLNDIKVAAVYSESATAIPLYYSSQSHNSLLLRMQDSKSLLGNIDLFNSQNLAYETGYKFDLGANLSLFNHSVEVGVNYYLNNAENAIFPILQNGSFELQNIASIKSKGYETSIQGRFWNYKSDFNYFPSLNFSTGKAKVKALKGDRSQIPIAGFAEVSKNLIVGEQTGSIVGSAYLRNDNGEVVIDADGYPMVAPDAKIIGNTTPDYAIGFNNEFRYKGWNFSFLFDYQKGGDVWNGTQQVLNYYGRSQTSANLRSTTNYIFNGVTASGTTNITPVSFADPNQDISQNRWVRYGYSGVAEEAIVDGSYLNLKSVSVSYDFGKRDRYAFFRMFKVALYANNVWCITKSKGVSPYSSLFNYSAGSGLQYFNMPLMQEVGCSVTIKI